MSKIWLVAICIMGIAGFALVFMLPKAKVNTPEFTKLQMTTDLLNKFVTTSQGQVWAFTPDQKVTVEPVQTKQSEEIVSIFVNLTSIAVIQPDKAKKDKVTVKLHGLARLNYEAIAGKWYLVEVNNIDLQVDAVK